jgi:hypothetical protein
MLRLARRSSVLAFAIVLAASSARAQDMNISLSRLSFRNEPWTDTNMNGEPDPGEFMDFNGDGDLDGCAGARGGAPERCPDEDAWRRVMTQFTGAMIPPILTPAGTRGVRGIYVGFETWITGIDNGEDYWHRAVEGDGIGVTDGRSRFVDSVLVWGRFNVRKGLPFGFELGANISYLANTTYWAPGLEIRWALFEGFREGVGWIPDLAVRAAVQTLVGDGEFNATVPTVDLILSEPFVIANSIEVIPYIAGQAAFVFADTELVDLTPETSAFSECDPDPRTPDPTGTTGPSGSPPNCRGDGTELNDNVVFPSIRTVRWRVGGGLQLRYEWFTLLGTFMFDAITPSEADGELPQGLPRQWQVDLGAGFTL